MNLKQKTEKLAEYIIKSENIVFFGGAGVSTESGIPDFRSNSGIYSGENNKNNKDDKDDKDDKNNGKEYDAPPEVMLSHSYFLNKPEKFYEFYRHKMIYAGAKPNDAHKILAKLEEDGRLKAVITQNIDDLHRLAGSKNVIELHGNVNRNFCLQCRKKFDVSYIIKSEKIPVCDYCGGIVKPDVVLYEEALNEQSVALAVNHIVNADMLIVGGTSLAVYPAAHYISYFYSGKKDKSAKKSAIINMSETMYDDMFDIAIYEDGIGSVLSKAYALIQPPLTEEIKSI